MRRGGLLSAGILLALAAGAGPLARDSSVPSQELTGIRLGLHPGPRVSVLGELPTRDTLPARDSGPSGSPGAVELPGAMAGGSLQELRSWIARREGRPIVLAFWATWCVPCVEEVPTLNALRHRYRKEGLEVLGVSLDSFTQSDRTAGRKLVAEFLRRHAARFAPFYYEGDPDPLAEAFGWPGPIPFAVVLDAQGAIRQRLMGSVSEETFLRRVGEAIAKRPDAGPAPDRAGE